MAWQLFDWAMYGACIRKERIDQGFRKGSSFCEYVFRRTLYKITQESLYKIEQGKQVPSAMQFMALNLALYGVACPTKVIDFCLGGVWNEIENGFGTFGEVVE